MKAFVMNHSSEVERVVMQIFNETVPEVMRVFKVINGQKVELIGDFEELA